MNRAEWSVRAREKVKRGTELPHARLTDADVLAIRANVRGMTARKLGEAYGVHHRTVERIRARETWTHLLRVDRALARVEETA